MASSNKTPHYQLSQFAPTDKPAWQGDYNSDMKKIDNGIYAAQNKADSLDASVSEATNKATQALEKAEAAEDAAENAAALAQEAKTTADNISGDLSGKVNKAGDTMTGPLVLSGDPTQPMEAATKQYVDQHGGGASGDFLPLSGGTLTGNLTIKKTAPMIALNPTADDEVHAYIEARYEVADNHVLNVKCDNTGLVINGSKNTVSMRGAKLTEVAAPTAPNDGANKQYVDEAVRGRGGGVVVDAGGSIPGVSVTLNPNLTLRFGNMIFLNMLVTVPQENANATLFTIPYTNLTGKRLTPSITMVPASGGDSTFTLTATVNGSNITIGNNEALTAGTYALNGWILIREE